MTCDPNSRPVFARILACVAPSPHLAVLVREAVAVAELCGSELVFLHVGTQGAAVEEGLRQAAPDEFKGAELVVRSGAPESVILREAATQEADLILAGALKSDPVLTSLRGSVSRRIARRADRSVLLTTHRRAGERPVRRIVAVVNFDAASLAMARDVVAMARRAGSEAVHFVHEYDGAGVRAAAHVEDTRSGQSRQAQAREAALRAELGDLLSEVDVGGLPVMAQTLLGHDFSESMRYADVHHADLICVPVPAGPIGPLDRFFRHPAESVLRQLTASVLLHRSGGKRRK